MELLIMNWMTTPCDPNGTVPFSLLIKPQQLPLHHSLIIPNIIDEYFLVALTSIYTSKNKLISNTYLHILKCLRYLTFVYEFSKIFPVFPFIHPSKTTMALRLPRIVSSKKVPKGYFAVYVGEKQKRFVIPVSFLNQPLFQDLLGMSEEEFGYSHPTGGLRIPCNEDNFLEVTSRLN
ncbi:hypothetical protein V6N13_134389 [Hibiscus sabdariffa]|uniref:Uncharacterized protein n=1 Tax=Hibiscus sabdariffa TaxID=183260 RepID=A0ABR2R3T2_9ROSI